MPVHHIIQPSFAAGELDPRLHNRIDTTIYRSGAGVLENVTVEPTGGVKRRPGTRLIEQLGIANDKVKLVPFVTSRLTKFMILFSPGAFVIYRQDGTQFDAGAFPIVDGADEPFENMTVLQSRDTLLAAHVNFPVTRLVIDETGGTATVDNPEFTFIPEINFSDTVGAARPEEQLIRLTGVGTGVNFEIELDGEVTDTIIRQGTDVATAALIVDALKALPNVDADDIEITFDTANSEPFRVRFLNNNAGYNWPLMKITVTSGADVMVVEGLVDGRPPVEPVMSATRGYPRALAIFQGRLWLGGFLDAPDVIVGSVVGDFFNLDNRSDEDDRGMLRRLDANDQAIIRHIYAGRHLQIFTDTAEYFVPRVPVTPATIAVKLSSERGTTPKIAPDEADGATIFLQAGGKALREFLFTDAENDYTAQSLTDRSSHLFSDPISMAVRISTDADEATLVLIAFVDGHVAVLTTNRFQEFAAWSRWTTDGVFVEIKQFPNGELWAITRRMVDGVDTYFLERFDETALMDQQVDYAFMATTTQITGIGGAIGTNVGLFIDRSYAGELAVTADTMDLPVAAETGVLAGRLFFASLKTLPARPDEAMDMITSRKKRILGADIELIDTAGLAVAANNQPLKPVSLNTLGDNLLDVPTLDRAVTDQICLDAFLGWDKSGIFEVSQLEPTPWQIRAVSIQVHF